MQHPGIDSLRLDAPHLELAHLVFHQRNERSNHDTHALHRHGWHLKADGLATSRRHQPQRVTSISNTLDDVFLNTTKTIVAPVLFKYGQILIHIESDTFCV